MYMYAERSDKGIKITTIRFYDSPAPVIQMLHIKYIEHCAWVAKRGGSQEQLDKLTFEEYLKVWGSRHVLMEITPGNKQPENLMQGKLRYNYKEKKRLGQNPKIVEIARELGYSVDK